MFKPIKTVFLLLLLLNSFSVYAKEISRKEVLEYISAMDKGINTKNAEIVGNLISDSATLEITVSSNGTSQTTRLNKVEYLKLLRSTWSMVSNYQYHRNNQQIVLSADKAIVTADVKESMIMNNRYISSNAIESATLKRVDGRIVIVSVVANGSM